MPVLFYLAVSLQDKYISHILDTYIVSRGCCPEFVVYPPPQVKSSSVLPMCFLIDLCSYFFRSEVKPHMLWRKRHCLGHWAGIERKPTRWNDSRTGGAATACPRRQPRQPRWTAATDGAAGQHSVGSAHGQWGLRTPQDPGGEISDQPPILIYLYLAIFPFFTWILKTQFEKSSNWYESYQSKISVKVFKHFAFI